MNASLLEAARAIAAKYKFKEFDTKVEGHDLGSDSKDSLQACVNHLDQDFMSQLSLGNHLDTSVLPL